MAIQSQMQKHLRKYVEDGIQQKVRLSNMIKGYKNQEVKSKERVIDETDLKRKIIAQGLPMDKVNLVEQRKEMDTQVLARVQKVLEDAQSEMQGLTLRMNAHLEELTEIEILAGGFVTHAIGVDAGVELDKDAMIVKFKPGGHIEVPIAARMNKWKDSSQLVIKKIKKVGV